MKGPVAMTPLTAAQLLMVWERGLNLALLDKALALLVAACPESDPETIADWPIGERDARLLQLREWIFGPLLVNTAQCPQCAERVEWQSRVSDFTRPAADATAAGDELRTADWAVRFRLPTSKDLAAVMHLPGAGAARALLNGCIVSASHGGATCPPESLPEAVLMDLTARIEALDPLADIRISLTCPRCAHQWNAWFDITGYLWAEIQHWAEQTLATVHQLARAYGWSENDILGLSPVRRQLYLGMIYS
jgi:hypothetical protein